MSADGEQERFERAAEHVRSNSALRLNNEQKLQLYGYFKQVLYPAYLQLRKLIILITFLTTL